MALEDFDYTFNLVEYLADNYTHDELLELLVKLDLRVADWDFTRMVHKHFKKEMKEYKREMLRDRRDVRS